MWKVGRIMLLRVLVVSEEKALGRSEDIIVWDYVNAPKDCKDYYIGHVIGRSYHYEEQIEDCSITVKQFEYAMSGVVFNGGQLKELSKEIELLEELNIGDQDDLDVIKTGIKIALDKNLYLRFRHD